MKISYHVPFLYFQGVPTATKKEGIYCLTGKNKKYLQNSRSHKFKPLCHISPDHYLTESSGTSDLTEPGFQT